MIKIAVCASLLFIVSFVSAFEPPYDQATVASYLKEKSAIVLATKIGGNLGFHEYKNLVSLYSNRDINKLFVEWKKINTPDKTDEFVTLNVVKGEQGLLSPVFRAQQNSAGHDATELGGTYFIFLRQQNSKNGATFSYSPCDVFSVENMKNELIRELAHKSYEDIVDQLILNGNVPCIEVEINS